MSAGPRRFRRFLHDNGLTLVLLGLFVLMILGQALAGFAAYNDEHAFGGTAEYYDEQRTHGEPEVSVAEFVRTPEFWYQSLQNWQSDFLAAGSLVFLAIFLRQRGSPESKPVDAPHGETGT